MLPDDLERTVILTANVAFLLKVRQIARDQFRQMIPGLIGVLILKQQRDERLPLQFRKRITGDRQPVRVDHQDFISSVLGQDDGLRGFQDVGDEVTLLDDLAHALGEVLGLLRHFGIQRFQLVRERDRRIV